MQEKRHHVEWLLTTQMPADGLIKALTRQKHDTFVMLLGLVAIKVSLLVTAQHRAEGGVSTGSVLPRYHVQ